MAACSAGLTDRSAAAGCPIYRYSALKMDGKPLYEYARNNIPLPRPIEARSATVHSLRLVDWKNGDEHDYVFPETELSEEEIETVKKLEDMVQKSSDEASKEVVGESVPTGEESGNQDQQVICKLGSSHYRGFCISLYPLFSLHRGHLSPSIVTPTHLHH